MTASSDSPAPETGAAGIGWRAALDPRHLKAPSILVMIAANLLPLYGVLYWGWDLFGLILLYWTETSIIGFFAIAHMGLATGWAALFFVPFFILHFGGFMAGHLVMLIVMFGNGLPNNIEDIPLALWSTLRAHGFLLVGGALFISHGVFFGLNVLRPMFRKKPGARPLIPAGEAHTLMTAPYGRVVVMHLTVMAGAVLVAFVPGSLAPFVFLILLKTIVDVLAQVRQNVAARVAATA